MYSRELGREGTGKSQQTVLPSMCVFLVLGVAVSGQPHQVPGVCLEYLTFLRANLHISPDFALKSLLFQEGVLCIFY